MLNIAKRLEKDVTILDLRGKLRVGGTDERLMDEVNGLLGQAVRKILINLELVTFVDSAGLGALIRSRRVVTEGGGQFGLLKVTARIESLLSVAGLIDHFRRFESEAEALTAMATSWPVGPPGDGARRGTTASG